MYNVQKKFVHYLVAVPIPCCPFGGGQGAWESFLELIAQGKVTFRQSSWGKKSFPKRDRSDYKSPD